MKRHGFDIVQTILEADMVAYGLSDVSFDALLIGQVETSKLLIVTHLELAAKAPLLEILNCGLYTISVWSCVPIGEVQYPIIIVQERGQKQLLGSLEHHGRCCRPPSS